MTLFLLSSLKYLSFHHCHHVSHQFAAELVNKGFPRRFNRKNVLNSIHFRHFKRSLCSSTSMAIKVLNVAEKNDAAKNIASLLSNGTHQRRDGVAIYNKLYEFKCHVPVIGHEVNMIMTSVSGHMTNYDFTSTHSKWHSCNPVELFDAPITKFVPKEFDKVKDNIISALRSCSHLIIWTDCDREGENIGFEVIDLCRQFKPNIVVYRAKFSEITKRSITSAIQNLAQPDKRASDAVDVRQQLDLRIGAAFTRFQTMFFQKSNIPLPAQLASYGSCQFPTLGFVVDRYLERENFIVSPFWYLDVRHKKDNIDVHFTWEKGRVTDIHVALDRFMTVMEEPIIAKVISAESKPKSKWRPTPLDTISFEKLASSKLRMSAKTAMKVAEKLYTSGIISYPRTETNIFPPSLNLKQFVDQQIASPAWGSFASRVSEEGVTPRQGKKTDNAHPPIYPTKYPPTSLSGDEAKVYELIARHFLACCSKDAEGKETTIVIDIRGEKFKTSGLIIFARNYLEVYPYDKWSGKELPDYQMSETFTPSEIQMKEGETSPPQLLTESDLIALMEKHGIGTDATHADHIETIKDRKYVTMTSDRRFLPLTFGLGLIEGYKMIKEEMSKPHLRASLERDLQSICDGNKSPADVLKNQIAMYKQVFIDVGSKSMLLKQAVQSSINSHPELVENPGHSNHHGRGNDGGNNENRRDLGHDSHGFGAGGEDSPACNCGQTAVKKTSTSVKNPGREFYGCSGGRNGCDFFAWVDSNAGGRGTSTTGGRRGNSTANGRGSSTSAGNSTRTSKRGRVSSRGKSSSTRGTAAPKAASTRKCGNCGGVGHNRTQCPSAGGGGAGPSNSNRRVLSSSVSATNNGNIYDDFFDDIDL